MTRVVEALRTVSERALMMFAALHNIPCRRWQTLENCSLAEVLERSGHSRGSEAATTVLMLPRPSWMVLSMARKSARCCRCSVMWYEYATSCPPLPPRLQQAVAAATTISNDGGTIMSLLPAHPQPLMCFAKATSPWWWSGARCVRKPVRRFCFSQVSVSATPPPSQQ